LKRLLRLYPGRWRQRYEREVDALLARQRPSLAGVVDLVRGAFRERFQAGEERFFVPNLGFRPAGTRVLDGQPTAEQASIRVTAIALSASAQETDVIVEWERLDGDAPECVPGDYLAYGHEPRDVTKATLMAAGVSLLAHGIDRNAYGSGMYGTHALYTLHFPPLPAGTASAELRLRESGREFQLPVELAPAIIRARPLRSAVHRDGVTIRATSTAWAADELIVALEIEGPRTIRRVAAGLAQPVAFRSVPEDVRRQRTQEMRRVMGQYADPILVEDGQGGTTEELRRVFRLPARSPEVESIQRFDVVFPAPPAGVDEVTLSVPFVELIDRTVSVTVDLRALPSSVVLGADRFTVASAELRQGSAKVILDIPRSTERRRFVQPARFVGTEAEAPFSWGGQDGAVWFDGPVADPPIVRFQGSVERIDGPWRLRIALRE
jgi:hypothetical protein